MAIGEGLRTIRLDAARNQRADCASISTTIMAVHVTEKAAVRIRENLAKQNIPTGGLRLGVKGGGCSGLSYVMRYEQATKPGDKVFEENGARLFVDLKSYLYLKGMTLDWKGSLMHQSFVFINPNASKTCSCGHSFSV